MPPEYGDLKSLKGDNNGQVRITLHRLVDGWPVGHDTIEKLLSESAVDVEEANARDTSRSYLVG